MTFWFVVLLYKNRISESVLSDVKPISFMLSIMEIPCRHRRRQGRCHRRRHHRRHLRRRFRHPQKLSSNGSLPHESQSGFGMNAFGLKKGKRKKKTQLIRVSGTPECLRHPLPLFYSFPPLLSFFLFKADYFFRLCSFFVVTFLFFFCQRPFFWDSTAKQQLFIFCDAHS